MIEVKEMDILGAGYCPTASSFVCAKDAAELVQEANKELKSMQKCVYFQSSVDDEGFRSGQNKVSHAMFSP